MKNRLKIKVKTKPTPKPAQKPKSDLLDELNPEQRQAAKHGVKGHGDTIAGPLAVIAGAGTGKTAVIASRTAYLIANGVDPRRICLMTFTNKAAREIATRVGSKLAKASNGQLNGGRRGLPWAGTFHSVGLRLIRIHKRQLGLPDKLGKLDSDDAERLMDVMRQDCGLAELELEFPKKDTCLAIYSRTINSQQPLRKVLKKHFAWARDHEANLKNVFKAYETAKREQGVLDFDDMLLLWRDLLSNAQIAAEIGGRFDHVLVDEFQDTNILQAEIIRLLKPDGRGVTIVGDEAQAIYSFRSANVDNILGFPASFDPHATLIKLERNYRSTPPILEASNAIINLSPLGFGKNLITAKTGGTKPRLVSVMDAEGEAEMIAEEIQTRVEQGRSLKGNAVLFQAAGHSRHLEVELTRRRIAFKKFGGQTFTEAAHIKDLLAVLRLAENPADMMSGLRVLELLEGIGAVTARKLFDSLTPDDFVGGLKRCVPPARAREAWPDFLALMRRLHRDKIGWPAEVDAVRNWLVPMLPRLYIDDLAGRALDLEQLQSMASSFKSRTKFLTDLTLEPPTKNKRVGLARPATEEESDEFVTLSTTHAAKGLQWGSVYVLNVTEGGFPSSRAQTEADIEEQRRLLYVAMTRAESELTLTVPLRVDSPGSFGSYDAIGRRSRFVPDNILRHFDVGTWRADQEEDDQECVPGRSPKAEIAARIQGRWGD